MYIIKEIKILKIKTLVKFILFYYVQKGVFPKRLEKDVPVIYPLRKYIPLSNNKKKIKLIQLYNYIPYWWYLSELLYD